MSDQLTLAAETRDRVGKGASRSLRREGRVPAVIYGNKEEPTPDPCRGKGAVQAADDRPFHEFGGDGRHRRQASAHAAQGRRVRRRHRSPGPCRFPAHLRTRQGARQRAGRTSPTKKRRPASSAAACSTSSATSSSWSVDAAEIPDEITISLTGLEVGDSIHISHVTLPKGAKSAIDDRDFTIATIVAPSALKSSEGDTEDRSRGEAEAPRLRTSLVPASRAIGTTEQALTTIAPPPVR